GSVTGARAGARGAARGAPWSRPRTRTGSASANTSGAAADENRRSAPAVRMIPTGAASRAGARRSAATAGNRALLLPLGSLAGPRCARAAALTLSAWTIVTGIAAGVVVGAVTAAGARVTIPPVTPARGRRDRRSHANGRNQISVAPLTDPPARPSSRRWR